MVARKACRASYAPLPKIIVVILNKCRTCLHSVAHWYGAQPEGGRCESGMRIKPTVRKKLMRARK